MKKLFKRWNSTSTTADEYRSESSLDLSTVPTQETKAVFEKIVVLLETTSASQTATTPNTALTAESSSSSSQHRKESKVKITFAIPPKKLETTFSRTGGNNAHVRAVPLSVNTTASASTTVITVPTVGTNTTDATGRSDNRALDTLHDLTATSTAVTTYTDTLNDEAQTPVTPFTPFTPGSSAVPTQADAFTQSESNAVVVTGTLTTNGSSSSSNSSKNNSRTVAAVEVTTSPQTRIPKLNLSALVVPNANAAAKQIPATEKKNVNSSVAAVPVQPLQPPKHAPSNSIEQSSHSRTHTETDIAVASEHSESSKEPAKASYASVVKNSTVTVETTATKLKKSNSFFHRSRSSPLPTAAMTHSPQLTPRGPVADGPSSDGNLTPRVSKTRNRRSQQFPAWQNTSYAKYARLLSSESALLSSYLSFPSEKTWRLLRDLQYNENAVELLRQDLKYRRDPVNWDSLSDLDNINTGYTEIDVKLLITEVDLSFIKESSKHLLSPILSSYKLGSVFGQFRTALLIGPFYLEWNETSLVVPRKCFLKSLDFTSEAIPIGKCYVWELCEKIAKIIVQYNTQHVFHPLHDNCQTFVNAVLDALGRKKFTCLDGTIGRFLENVSNYGYYTPTMPVPRHMLGRYSFSFVNEDEVTFDSHEKLDRFAKTLKQINLSTGTNSSTSSTPRSGRATFMPSPKTPSGPTPRRAASNMNSSLSSPNRNHHMYNFYWELWLLQQFDLAFWLRHNELKELEKKQGPLSIDKQFRPVGPHECPFIPDSLFDPVRDRFYSKIFSTPM